MIRRLPQLRRGARGRGANVTPERARPEGCGETCSRPIPCQENHGRPGCPWKPVPMSLPRNQRGRGGERCDPHRNPPSLLYDAPCRMRAATSCQETPGDRRPGTRHAAGLAGRRPRDRACRPDPAAVTGRDLPLEERIEPEHSGRRSRSRRRAGLRSSDGRWRFAPRSEVSCSRAHPTCLHIDVMPHHRRCTSPATRSTARSVLGGTNSNRYILWKLSPPNPLDRSELVSTTHHDQGNGL
jgi:hypothetical protein